MGSQTRGDSRREAPVSTHRTDGLAVAWRKSSHSNHQSACVELADFDHDTVGFRDSKDPQGPVLTFDRAAVRTFLAAVAEGEFSGR